MDFEGSIAKIVSRIKQVKSRVGTEEATKTSLIMPMITALGYDPFDPDEVCPEYTADFGTKQKEKIDYAILKDNEPIILMECKPAHEELTSKHGSQLFRYFSTSSAKIAVLTNGVVYKFYSDFEAPNKMDKKPFFEIDIEKASPEQLTELKRFSKPELDINKLVPAAKNMLVMQNLVAIISTEMDNPSEDFVRFIVAKCYDGRMLQKIIDEYTPMIKAACAQLIKDRIHSKLMIAMEQTDKTVNKASLEEVAEAIDEIETTDEEVTGFRIVQAICAKIVPIDRVHIRDSKTYCAVLFDDNNRKPIVRMHFNTAKKQLSLFGADKTETRVPLDGGVSDIYKYQDQIRETVQGYVK